jgi:hypothetical protein
MVGNEDIAAKIAEIQEAATTCSTAETSDNYEVLKERLAELESLTKRSLVSHAIYRPLVSKLQTGAALTDEERKTLRTLVIGEADYYLKYDDDFARNKGEAGKIVGEVQRLLAGELDLDALMHVGVLCREACSALVPTVYYLSQKERVGKFEAATGGPIDEDAGRVLASIITGIMTA